MNNRLLFEPITKSDIAVAEIVSGNSAGTEIWLNTESCEGKCRRPGPCCEEAEQTPMKRINLKDGKMVPMPREDTASHGFIFGPTSSGKSVFCVEYAQQYQRIYPDNPIYLVSYVEEDDSIDKIDGLIRIPLDDIINGDITGKAIENSLIIFDDVDALPPKPEGVDPQDFNAKEIFAKVEELRDQLLTTGRHFGVSCLITSHLGADFKHTKKPINESSFVVVFPRAGNFAQVDRILRVYAGLTKKQVSEIQQLPSRWVYLYKHFPNYIVHEKGIYLL